METRQKAYLFIYGNAVGSREEMVEFVDNIPQIENWRYELPNTFYLISNLSSQELYTIIQKRNREIGVFLIMEINPSNMQGWLSKESWDFLVSEYEKDKILT